MVKRRGGNTRRSDGTRKNKKELCNWLIKYTSKKDKRKSKRKSSSRASSTSASSSRSRSLRSIANILAKKPKDCYKLKAKDLRKFVKEAGHKTRYDGKQRSVKKMCGTERKHYRKQAKAGAFAYPYDASQQSEQEYKLSKLFKARDELNKMIAKQEAKGAAASSSASSGGSMASSDASIAAAAAREMLGDVSSDASSVSSSSGDEGSAGVAPSEAHSAMGQAPDMAAAGVLPVESAEMLMRIQNDPETQDGVLVMFEGKQLKFDGAQKKFVQA